MRWKGRIHFIARSTLPVVLQGNKSVSFHNPSVTNPAMLATCSVCLRQNVYHTTQISAFHVLYKTVNLSSNMILEIPIFSSQTTLKNSKMKNVFTMTLTCTYQVTDKLVHLVRVLSRVRLCNLMDYCPSGSSVHGIFKARTLEWVAIFSSRGCSPPRDQPHISCSGRSHVGTPKQQTYSMCSAVASSL